jgi:hypothetical protein
MIYENPVSIQGGADLGPGREGQKAENIRQKATFDDI